MSRRAKLVVTLEAIRSLLGLPECVIVTGVGVGNLVVRSDVDMLDIHVAGDSCPEVLECLPSPIVTADELRVDGDA